MCNKQKGSISGAEPKSRLPLQGEILKEGRFVQRTQFVDSRWKGEQTDKFSTAYETVHTKEKVDMQNKVHEKWLEGSSRFVEQHVEKSDWTTCSVKEC